MRFIGLFILFTLPLLAAEPLNEKERLDRVAAEVQRRMMLRKQAVIAEESARRVVREHDSGTRKASDEELAAARIVIREADESRAKEISPRSKPAGKEDSVSLRLPDADMQTVASACRHLFGGPVTVSDRVKSKIVMVSFSAVPLEEARKKLIDGLRASGIYVIHQSDGILLDSEPEKTPSK